MIKFPDSLTVENVNAFHKELLAALKDPLSEKEMVFELGSLNHTDFSGVQLIASVCKTQKTEGRSLYIKNISPSVEQIFSLSELEAFIGKGGESI